MIEKENERGIIQIDCWSLMPKQFAFFFFEFPFFFPGDVRMEFGGEWERVVESSRLIVLFESHYIQISAILKLSTTSY